MFNSRHSLLSKNFFKTLKLIFNKKYQFKEGEHTLTKTVTISKIGGLAMFTKKKETCLNCKTILTEFESKNAVCNHCKSKPSL